jgi:hypothetical protein
MRDLTGCQFQAGNTTFKVVNVDNFPADRVSERYRRILGIKPGFLVAVWHRGVCIPNITLRDGVARLTKVEVDGKVLDRPGAISKALGVSVPMSPYQLNEL